MDIAPILAAAKSGTGAATNNTASTPQTASASTVSPEAAPKVATATIVNEGRIFASPLAKKLAAEKGVDLKYVKGSGDN
ncbi:E3 binding domain-containing protein, partial [Acinetobacter baumannii]